MELLELIVICITIYAIFGNYMNAHAEMIYQKAREKELQNLDKEFEPNEN